MSSFVVIVTLVAVINVELASSILMFSRIINGESTTIEDRPFQVSIQKSTIAPPYYCSGSIISKQYVVTAAHCVRPGQKYLTIRAGSTDHNRGGSIHHIERFIIHDDYKKVQNNILINDIALLKVKEPFKFDKTRQPIKLFQTLERARPGAQAVISGWGKTQFGKLSKQLKKVTLPIVSKKECKKAYRNDGGLPEGQICAGYLGVEKKDSCGGDSGGPLTINGRLAGVVSWAIGCAEPEYPGAYTEIAYYRDWIRNNSGV